MKSSLKIFLIIVVVIAVLAGLVYWRYASKKIVAVDWAVDCIGGMIYDPIKEKCISIPSDEAQARAVVTRIELESFERSGDKVADVEINFKNPEKVNRELVSKILTEIKPVSVEVLGFYFPTVEGFTVPTDVNGTPADMGLLIEKSKSSIVAKFAIFDENELPPKFNAILDSGMENYNALLLHAHPSRLLKTWDNYPEISDISVNILTN